MSEVEDRAFIERKLATILTVTLTTRASGALKALTSRAPVERDAALRDLVTLLTGVISDQFEVGQLDANSRLYVTNYVEPRDPFDRHPTRKR